MDVEGSSRDKWATANVRLLISRRGFVLDGAQAFPSSHVVGPAFSFAYLLQCKAGQAKTKDSAASGKYRWTILLEAALDVL